MDSPDIVPVRRALLSLSDKSGLVELATALVREFNVELVSTGGTARAIQEAGLPVRDVADLTGFPEMMDGRVKTLHPAVHGGLLALRDAPSHQQAMRNHGISPIDLLVVNLYPFEKVTADPACPFDHAVENIDIGGPAMVRSASKNHRSVAVVTDPIQYEKLLNIMRAHKGGTTHAFRLDLAMWAFGRTAQYDAAIHAYISRHYFASKNPESAELAGLTPQLIADLSRVQLLRYGENPHQRGAFYAASRPPEGVAAARQLHGKELSWINLLDADAALGLVREFTRPAAAVIKHANPCGCATADSPAEAFDLAYAGDPIAAFGGIVALNRSVDVPTAQSIVQGKRFLEVLIAPDFQPAALAMLQSRWADCRLLATGPANAVPAHRLDFRSVAGGMLVQETDMRGFNKEACRVVSKVAPTDAQWADMEFVWLACKHVKSNAIALAAGGQLLAAGAGQMSRVTSCRLAVELARQNGHAGKLPQSVAASDAFFPFADGPQLLISAGVRAIIQPGGSKRDQETIDLCDQHKVALVLTGERHFRH